MSLEGKVDIPVIGSAPKKYVAVAVFAIVGIAGFAWYRRTTGDTTAGVLGPDDALYADTRTGSDIPSDAYQNPGGGGADDGSSSDAPRAPRNNEEWAQRVIEKLTWYEPQAVSSAVGLYLSRQPVTDPTGQTIIREAWAQLGRPPFDMPLVTSGTAPTPAAPAKPPTPAAGSKRGYGWYLVKKGDSMPNIAAKYGVALTTMYLWNGADALRVGEWLKVRMFSNPIYAYNGK